MRQGGAPPRAGGRRITLNRNITCAPTAEMAKYVTRRSGEIMHIFRNRRIGCLALAGAALPAVLAAGVLTSGTASAAPQGTFYAFQVKNNSGYTLKLTKVSARQADNQGGLWRDSKFNQPKTVINSFSSGSTEVWWLLALNNEVVSTYDVVSISGRTVGTVKTIMDVNWANQTRSFCSSSTPALSCKADGAYKATFNPTIEFNAQQMQGDVALKSREGNVTTQPDSHTGGDLLGFRRTDIPQAADTFTVVPIAGDAVALKSKLNGKYIAAGNSDLKMRASSDQIGPKEKFIIEKTDDGSTVLKWDFSNQYVRNEGGGTLVGFGTKEQAAKFQVYNI